jgi:ferritin-like protein
MASEGLHEPASALDDATIERHRAIVSLKEELEAVDWYDQRVTASADPSLAAVLAHNRDEEKEHASMTLEWLRRRDPVLDQHLRTYLFTSGSITEEEAAAEGGPGPEAGSPEVPGGGSLGIGSLKGSE